MASDLSFIGRNIRFLRRSRNWTLEDLAGRIGIHKVALGRIERGLNLPSAMVIYHLSSAFNVTVDTLFSSDSLHQAPVETGDTTDTCFISLDQDQLPSPKLCLQPARRSWQHSMLWKISAGCQNMPLYPCPSLLIPAIREWKRWRPGCAHIFPLEMLWYLTILNYLKTQACGSSYFLLPATPQKWRQSHFTNLPFTTPSFFSTPETIQKKNCSLLPENWAKFWFPIRLTVRKLCCFSNPRMIPTGPSTRTGPPGALLPLF